MRGFYLAVLYPRPLGRLTNTGNYFFKTSFLKKLNAHFPSTVPNKSPAFQIGRTVVCAME